MGLFTSKTKVMPSHALIGEDCQGDVIWNTADYEYAVDMHNRGVLEHRGWKNINGIQYSLYYLPGPRTY